MDTCSHLEQEWPPHSPSHCWCAKSLVWTHKRQSALMRPPGGSSGLVIQSWLMSSSLPSSCHTCRPQSWTLWNPVNMQNYYRPAAHAPVIIKHFQGEFGSHSGTWDTGPDRNPPKVAYNIYSTANGILRREACLDNVGLKDFYLRRPLLLNWSHQTNYSQTNYQTVSAGGNSDSLRLAALSVLDVLCLVERVNTGTPQSCILRLHLYSVYTHQYITYVYYIPLFP